MTPRRALALLVLAVAVGGCASSPSSSSSTSAAPPRVRCLSDPSEMGTRPLIFLFCIQSP